MLNFEWNCQLLAVSTIVCCTFDCLFVFLQKKIIYLTLLWNTRTSKNAWVFWKQQSTVRRDEQPMFWNSSILSERSGKRTKTLKSKLVIFDFLSPWHVPCCFHIVISLSYLFSSLNFYKGIHGKQTILDPHYIWNRTLWLSWARNSSYRACYCFRICSVYNR